MGVVRGFVLPKSPTTEDEGSKSAAVGESLQRGELSAGNTEMDEKDLLKYIENLEKIISRKQKKLNAMEAISGITDQSRCIAYSMSKPIFQIRRDAERIEDELKRFYDAPVQAAGATVPASRQDTKELHGLLDRLEYHTNILNELLDSIQKNRWTIPPGSRKADLNNVIRHWKKHFKMYPLFNPAIRIKLRLSRDMPLLDMRTCELYQIVYHLTRNAIEALASADGGVVSIKTDNLGDNVLFEVMDNGYGIRPQIREKIFKPFYSTKISPDDGEHHPGLGLYTATRIAEECGGRIDLDSEPGIGSVFSVFLPLGKETKRSSGSDSINIEQSPPARVKTRNVPDEN